MKKFVQATAVLSLLAFAAAQQQAPADTAYVRVAHLAPNAQEVSVNLTGANAEALSPDELSGLAYRDVTDYLAVPAGDYDVTVDTQEGDYQQNLNLGSGVYYTVAALGLVAPGGLDQTQAQEDTGFFGFGGGGDALGFRLEVLEEDISTLTTAQPVATPAPAAPATPADPAAQPADPAQPVDPAAQPVDPAAPAAPAAPTGTVGDPAATTTLVTARLVHAAPGVAPISLVNVIAGGAEGAGEEVDVLINNVPFADVSNYSDLDPAQVANLELRIEESAAAALSLSDTTLEANTVYTMFAIGTPVSGEPLEILLVGTTLDDQGGGQTAQQDDQQDDQGQNGQDDQGQDDQQDDQGQDDQDN